jgi:hypothetical protein
MTKFEYASGYQEMVKTTCVEKDGHYFIQEYVNADFYRYYEI